MFPIVSVKRQLGNSLTIQHPPLARFGKAERLAISLFGHEIGQKIDPLCVSINLSRAHSRYAPPPPRSVPAFAFLHHRRSAVTSSFIRSTS